MKILITGGSGAVGKPLIAFVCAHGIHDITVFDLPHRKSKKFYAAYQDKLTVRYGDLRNIEEVEAVCENIDMVIHLAAIIPPLADEKPELAHDINVKGTQNLLRALEKKSKHAFFLYASSVSVYGDRLSHHQIQVGDPLQPSFADKYAETKIMAEQLVQESKLDWSIFRLAAVFGIGNHKISGLMFHMPLQTPIEFATPQDTARAFFQAITKKELLSEQIFNLGGGPSCRLRYKEFLATAFRITGLGELTFPDGTFAEKNFHCGFYADGDQLEEILSFRHDSVASYFQKMDASIHPIQRQVTILFRPLIKAYLLRQSDPYKALRNNHAAEIERYFH